MENKSSCAFPRKEKLKSKKLIEKLYKNGKSVKAFPLRMVYLETVHTSKFPCQVAISVPKRNFKLAVDRNRIKRLLRETYRLQKQLVYENVDKPHIFMISYIAKEAWSTKELHEKMEKLLTLFICKVKNKSQTLKD